MGLDINSVHFLLGARRRGVGFNQTLTIGRQDLNVYPSKLRHVLETEGLPAKEFAEDQQPESRYADGLFRALGAESVSALDASDFEGAAIVHDLNAEIPGNLRERFDVVYDGGTLEHIFNFPVALKNCMEMVKSGGRLFLHIVANNYCGHGFYQFSPELFYRALNEANGFALERMVLHAMGPYGRWYEVSDPEKIQQRVELMTLMPVQLLVQAQRRTIKPIFSVPPQQSDYTPRWAGGDKKAAAEAFPNVDYAPSRGKLSTVWPGLARLVNAAKTGINLLSSHTVRNRRRFKKIPKK